MGPQPDSAARGSPKPPQEIPGHPRKRALPQRPAQAQAMSARRGMIVATVRQSKTKAQRIRERAERRRVELWPEIPTEKNWDRKGSDGFTTVPRVLALVGMIADMLAEKNKRVSSTYWGLWCRVWDTGVVIIENEYELATEAGFTGERRVYTWRDRIKQLVTLGFIEVQAGPKGPYQYALIMNPYHVLFDRRREGRIQDQAWMTFVERTEEIAARDLVRYEASLAEEGKANG